MKVRELIEELEGLDGDKEVLLAIQPSWPLAHRVARVVDLSESFDPSLEGTDRTWREYAGQKSEEGGVSAEDTAVVWIAASEGNPYDRSPYAPRQAWEGC